MSVQFIAYLNNQLPGFQKEKNSSLLSQESVRNMEEKPLLTVSSSLYKNIFLGSRLAFGADANFLHKITRSENSVWNNALVYSYGSDDRNKFIVLKPADEKNNKKVMLYVHGGGFKGSGELQTEDTAFEAKLFKTYIDKGYTVVTVGYRTMHEAPFSTTIKDIADGITAAHSLFEKEKDDYKFILTGLSAGCTAGGMLLYYDKYPDRNGNLCDMPRIPQMDYFLCAAGLFDPETVADGVNTDLYNDCTDEDKRNYSSVLPKEGENKTPRSTTPALILQGDDDVCQKNKGYENSGAQVLAKFLNSDTNNNLAKVINIHCNADYNQGCTDSWVKNIVAAKTDPSDDRDYYNGHCGPQWGLEADNEAIWAEVNEFLGKQVNLE